MADTISADRGDSTGGAVRRSDGAVEIRAVTPRAVATALVVIAVSILWNEWISYYIKGSNISRSHFPMAFFFPFLTVCVLNMLMKIYSRSK